MRTRPWFYYFANRAMRAIFDAILRLELRGVENVPRDGALIIAISHSSFIDPVLMGVYLPREVVPMAKIEAFDIPILGACIRWYGAFAVRRGEVDVRAFKNALEILRGQIALVIAPEGHRSETGMLQRGREGAIMLSLRSGAAILPVAVWGGKPLWKNLARLRRTEMKIFVGKPVAPTAPNPTRDQITEMSDELMLRFAALMPRELHGYYRDWSRPVTGWLKEVSNVK
ncbi:MAG: lysophospholipid acyltransferase family protein [Chloroflexota bacterium]